MTNSNDDFISCWNEILVPKWNRFRHILSGNGAVHSEMAQDYFKIQPGDKVLVRKVRSSDLIVQRHFWK